MNFELSVPEKIIFGKGSLARLGPLVSGFGNRVLIVHGANSDRGRSVEGLLAKSTTTLYPVRNEPSIEGIAKGDELHPMQAAFRDNHGLQCGYCTPGMIMSAIDVVHRHGGKLDEATVRQELEGNICRCTGYHNIVKAVLDAAGRMKVSQAAE